MGGSLLVVLAACGSGAVGPASSPPLASSLPPSDLVYEREVNGNQDLYVLPADGGPERRLTTHPSVDGLPRWSPDGRSVLFASEREGHWQLFEVAAEGGEPRRVRATAFRELQADISPDGGRLAFLSNADDHEALWTMNRATGVATAIVRHGARSVLGNPHWSPDGSRIVFSSNHRIGHQIYVVDVAAGEVRRISGLTGGGCEPRFSRDGRSVVYVSRGHRRPTSRLVRHDLDSGQETVLVDWPALNYSPVFSLDGTDIAFSSNINGEWAIYRQRLSDGTAWRVPTGPGPARYPDYRPVLR